MTEEAFPINDDVARQVEDLVRQLFAESMDMDEPILGVNDDDIVAPNLHALIQDPENTIVELSEGGKVVGFNVAVPISKMNPARQEESGQTAYIYFTGIDPSQQGRGLVKDLNTRTFDILRQKGYSFVELDAMHSSGYAEVVSKNYSAAILSSREHDDWGLGQETFFRLDLSRVDPEN